MITLPVEQDDEGCYLTFTDDLLEATWLVSRRRPRLGRFKTDGTVIVTKHDSEAKTNNEND